MDGKYVTLDDLLVYKFSVELGKIAWNIYETLSWQDKKIMGDQFIESVDSVGANIAEGYGRYHFLDRIKFYYNSRGSLYESRHWCLRLYERNKISKEQYNTFMYKVDGVSYQLNVFIKSSYLSKNT